MSDRKALNIARLLNGSGSNLLALAQGIAGLGLLGGAVVYGGTPDIVFENLATALGSGVLPPRVIATVAEPAATARLLMNAGGALFLLFAVATLYLAGRRKAEAPEAAADLGQLTQTAEDHHRQTLHVLKTVHDNLVRIHEWDRQRHAQLCDADDRLEAEIAKLTGIMGEPSGLSPQAADESAAAVTTENLERALAPLLQALGDLKQEGAAGSDRAAIDPAPVAAAVATRVEATGRELAARLDTAFAPVGAEFDRVLERLERLGPIASTIDRIERRLDALADRPAAENLPTAQDFRDALNEDLKNHEAVVIGRLSQLSIQLAGPRTSGGAGDAARQEIAELADRLEQFAVRLETVTGNVESRLVAVAENAGSVRLEPAPEHPNDFGSFGMDVAGGGITGAAVAEAHENLNDTVAALKRILPKLPGAEADADLAAAAANEADDPRPFRETA